MPYSAYCLFFVPPNKRLDPVLCLIGKWLIGENQINQIWYVVFGKVKLESFFSRGNVPAESEKVISHLLGEIMIMISGPWGSGNEVTH
jgi:hypothetical protein